jgi:hypothetical protein
MIAAPGTELQVPQSTNKSWASLPNPIFWHEVSSVHTSAPLNTCNRKIRLGAHILTVVTTTMDQFRSKMTHHSY